jgi:hypothetical protein
VGEIEPAFAGNEKFPANGGFSIVKRYLNARASRHFRRPETRRAAADDGELGVGVQAEEASPAQKRVKDGTSRVDRIP